MTQEEQRFCFRSRLPLTGGDYFILALDHQMRRAGLPGNICRLVLNLDGVLPVDLLRAAIDAADLDHTLGRIRLSRRLPFSVPHWCLDRGPGRIPISVHTAEAMTRPECPPSVGGTTRLFNPRKSPLLGFEVSYGDHSQTTLVLAWHHGLMDAHGAELLLRLLDRQFARYGEPDRRGTFGGQEILRDHRSPGIAHSAERWRFARNSLFLIDEVCRPPIASVVAPPSRPAAGNSYFRIIFTEEETRRIDWAGERAGAGFQRSLYYLAAAMRAFHRMRLIKGDAEEACVVPLPVGCRRRGSVGPLLSNQVSFLFFRAEPEQFASLSTLVRSLSEQMREMMRREAATSFAAALDFFRQVPLPFYARLLGGPTGGKMASFYYSDTGFNLPGMDTFLGLAVTDLIHLAPVPFRPGLGIITGRFRGRIHLVFSWVVPCLSGDELDLMAASLAHDLLTGGFT